jgi:hypothetical protein
MQDLPLQKQVGAEKPQSPLSRMHSGSSLNRFSNIKERITSLPRRFMKKLDGPGGVEAAMMKVEKEQEKEGA